MAIAAAAPHATGPKSAKNTAATSPTTSESTPFSAVKDLGLKLEAKRVPVDTIVFDHVEAPGEN